MAVFKIEKNNKVIWCVKVVRYDTWTSERKQKKKEGFKARREALEWENNFLNGCKNDVNITFENLVHKYMEDCKARLAKTTIANKTYLIESKLTISRFCCNGGNDASGAGGLSSAGTAEDRAQSA